VQAFLHLTTSEIGRGLIALAVLAAASCLLISALILLMLSTRMARARFDRTGQRRAAQSSRRVDARLDKLASRRAG
jgi:hypothetical protein